MLCASTNRVYELQITDELSSFRNSIRDERAQGRATQASLPDLMEALLFH